MSQKEKEEPVVLPVQIIMASFLQRRKAQVSIRNMYIVAIFLFIGLAIVANDGVVWAGMITLVVVFLLCILLLSKIIPSKESIAEVQVFADKMESGLKPSHRRYLFFTKSDKWGVYDCRKFCVVVPAHYDSISWKKKGSSIIATKEGQTVEVKVGK